MVENGDGLPSELWTRVFLYLSPNQWRTGTYKHHEENKKLHPELHRLKLVCKKFKDLFLEHHDLFSVLLLRHNLEPQALPGLLNWLQRHNSDISCLQGYCRGPYVAAALTFLLGSQQLTCVHLYKATAVEVRILSMCTSLTTCWLVHPFQSLDVDCLKTLTKLGNMPGVGHECAAHKSTDLLNALASDNPHQTLWRPRLWTARAFPEGDV